MNKAIIITITVLVVVAVAVALLGMYKFNYLSGQNGYDVDGNKVALPAEPTGPLEGVTSTLESVSFTGTFEQYNTECFADGECSAIVDGKKIVTIVGWSQDVSGSFENPDIPVGTEVEVFAAEIDEENYTLYGSEEYYIRAVSQDTSVEEEVADTSVESNYVSGDIFIGLNEDQAAELAQREDILFRVVEREGEALAVTFDYREGRINASVKEGVVSSYTVE